MECEKVILTGDRPTGRLHLGHFAGSLRQRVELQSTHRTYIIIADMQALTDNVEQPDKVRDNILEVCLDYLSVGIDPMVATIFVQSLIPELAMLTMFFMNLVTVARLERNPTVKDEIAQKDFERSLPVGFLAYPVSQAADIAAFRATHIPVGADQLPMIEQTNEIVRRFNGLYRCNVLREAKAILSAVGRLPGTDGKAKMGKSLGNAIYLSDSEKTVSTKIRGMFTDPNHLRVEDPGTVEGNPVFAYLDAFDSDKDGLEEMKAHYRRGGLGDGIVKRRLNEVLQSMLEPIRRRRSGFANDPGEVFRLLREGSQEAREAASSVYDDVRRTMGIGYPNLRVSGS
ncbi:MAG: tryptophan--tRNA ligase [Patescibacteria group bacterium]